MFKKLAKVILKDELDAVSTKTTKVRQDVESMRLLYEEEKKTSSQLAEALDELQNKIKHTSVSTVKDLQLTKDELQLYRELGENPVYISMTDKMATRVVLITSQQRNITKEQMDRVNGVREGICQIVWDIQNEKSKQEKADPVTGEVTRK